MSLFKVCTLLLLCGDVSGVKVTSIQMDEPQAAPDVNATVPSKSTGLTSVKTILEDHPDFDASLFKMLLVRPDIDHIFLSDVEKLLNGIQNDFPEHVKLTSLGKTWEDRDIHLLTIDGAGVFAGSPGFV